MAARKRKEGETFQQYRTRLKHEDYVMKQRIKHGSQFKLKSTLDKLGMKMGYVR